jgi:hypothetical protein
MTKSITDRCPVSKFMLDYIPSFWDRFRLSYYREGSCIEYYISDLHSSETISSALILSFSRQKKDLHISRFYPELYLLPNSKYLSAVCFYLIVQHCSFIFPMDEKCHISLETVKAIWDNFYRKLADFNFVVSKNTISNAVELISDMIATAVDTSMIGLHMLKSGEIPFMK